MSLWNRFEAEKKNLNIYEHPAFEAESGITDVHEIRENILKMSDELKNEPRTLVKAENLRLYFGKRGHRGVSKRLVRHQSCRLDFGYSMRTALFGRRCDRQMDTGNTQNAGI